MTIIIAPHQRPHRDESENARGEQYHDDDDVDGRVFRKMVLQHSLAGAERTEAVEHADGLDVEGGRVGLGVLERGFGFREFHGVRAGFGRRNDAQLGRCRWHALDRDHNR